MGSAENGASRTVTRAGKRSSPFSGYHFAKNFAECPRKFYLRSILGLLRQGVAVKPAIGSAVHEGIHHFLLDQSESAARRAVEARLDEEDWQTVLDEDKDAAYALADRMFARWVEKIGARLHDRYEILSLEEPYEARTPMGYGVVTVPDRVVKHDGLSFVVDVKTTSATPNQIERSIRDDDQSTTYIWAVRQNGIPVSGWYTDIVSGRTLVSGPRVIAEKGDLIVRSDREIESWVRQLEGIISDYSARVWNLGSFSIDYLFPRCPSGCTFGGCAYPDLCRQPPDPAEVPPGYRRDERINYQTVIEHIRANGPKEEKK